MNKELETLTRHSISIVYNFQVQVAEKRGQTGLVRSAEILRSCGFSLRLSFICGTDMVWYCVMALSHHICFAFSITLILNVYACFMYDERPLKTS